MAGALRHTNGRFAQHWNTVRNSVGHMWQDRYYSCTMQPTRVWSVIRYVELNPVRAGIIAQAVTYRWSSALAHVSGHDERGLLDMDWWHNQWGSGDWSEVLRVASEQNSSDSIRRATYTGRPLGDAQFIASLEKQTGRKLALQKGGRPRRQILDSELAFRAGG